ncbi:uncharacterized protein LOC135132341 [Zophobas morio]|uniref:uncharacterized protein LOC135132341 n=1 Tax=Zophobas morio TaxID=2755281 RepID=UPI0030833768
MYKKACDLSPKRLQCFRKKPNKTKSRLFVDDTAFWTPYKTPSKAGAAIQEMLGRFEKEVCFIPSVKMERYNIMLQMIIANALFNKEPHPGQPGGGPSSHYNKNFHGKGNQGDHRNYQRSH